ncbi:MAG: invasion associated locus B family protein [Rhizobiaceae bacterium]|nr:invasion associated locus B family protein [Rhizobiaceae bacterium]
MQQCPLPVRPRTLLPAKSKPSAALLATVLCSWFVVPLAAAQTDSSEEADSPSSLQEVYQDWIVTCRKSDKEAETPESLCQMAQELRDKKSGQLIFSLVLPGKPLPNGANAVVVAPFGLDLSKGVTLSLLEPVPSDDADNESGFTARAVDPTARAPFRTCVPSGCLSQFTLNTEMKEAFRARTRALVSMVSIDQNRTINVPLSLRGFTAAERRLSALAKQFD